MNIYSTRKKSLLLLLLNIFAFSYGNDEQETIKNNSQDDAIIINEDEFNSLPTTENPSQEASHSEDDSAQENKPELLPEDIQKFTENSEIILKTILENFNKIDGALEHIALILNHKQIRIKNSKPLLDEIIKLRALTNMVLNTAYTEISPARIAQLVDLAQQLMSHIRYVLSTDLITFKSFDMQFTRSVEQPSKTFQEVEKQLNTNKQLLTKVESESENIGLNIFNITFRRLEKFENDYNIVNKCLWGIGITAGVAIIATMIDSYYHAQAKKLFTSIYDYFGHSSASASESISSQNSINETTNSSSGLPLPLSIFLRSLNNNQDNNQKTLPTNPINPNHNDSTIQNGGNGEINISNNIQISNEPWESDIPLYKRFLGDKPYNKVPLGYMKTMGVHVGHGTRAISLLEGLGIVSFALSPYPLYKWYGPKLLEVGTKALDWVVAKKAQLASFLRGGPIKKALGLWEQEITVTFDDIIGNEHAKMIFEPIISYLVNPEKFDRSGIQPKSAVLLAGPTRSGKTNFGQAVGGETQKICRENNIDKKPLFWYISTADLKKYGIRVILNAARYYAPVIVFIDELDKGGFQTNGDSNALCELQVAMSDLNLDISKKVIVIGAVNYPEKLDASIRADGRFGTIIPFTYPSFSERKEYIMRELTKRTAIIDESYVDRLAHETENANYDTLKNVITMAFQKAKLQGTSLSWEHLDQAANEKVHKIIFDKKILPKNELYTIAVHQAAHAFMRVLLQPNLQLTKVTIRPVAAHIKPLPAHEERDISSDIGVVEYGKVFTAHGPNALKFTTFEDLVHELQICLAGHIAEKIFFGTTSYSYHTDDTQNALEFAKQIVFAGMQEQEMPKTIKEQKLIEAYELVKKYEQEVTTLLTNYEKELGILTKILFDQKILSIDEIIHILRLIDEEKRNEGQGHNDKEQTDEAIETNASTEVIDSEIDLSE